MQKQVLELRREKRTLLDDLDDAKDAAKRAERQRAELEDEVASLKSQRGAGSGDSDVASLEVRSFCSEGGPCVH